MGSILLDQCAEYLGYMKVMFNAANKYLTKLNQHLYLNRHYRAVAYTNYVNSKAMKLRTDLLRDYIGNKFVSVSAKLLVLVLIEHTSFLGLDTFVNHIVIHKNAFVEFDMDYIMKVRTISKLNAKFLKNVFKKCVFTPAPQEVNKLVVRIRDIECEIIKLSKQTQIIDEGLHRNDIVAKITEICNSVGYYNLF